MKGSESTRKGSESNKHNATNRKTTRWNAPAGSGWSRLAGVILKRRRSGAASSVCAANCAYLYDHRANGGVFSRDGRWSTQAKGGVLAAKGGGTHRGKAVSLAVTAVGNTQGRGGAVNDSAYISRVSPPASIPFSPSSQKATRGPRCRHHHVNGTKEMMQPCLIYLHVIYLVAL